jgi:hypothetical protein
MAVLSTSDPAWALFEDWAVGPKIGTLGLGGEVTTDLIPQVNLRGSLQWLDLAFDAEFESVDYDVDLDVFNPLLVVDWHVFNDAFRISGGVLCNGPDIGLDARPNEPVEIGGTEYTPEQVGTLRGEAEYRDFSPYVGIGWGNALSPDHRWGLSIDLGVVFIGPADVELSATGPIASDPTFQARLAEEENDIEDELKDYGFYPVLCLSLFFRF